MNFSSFIPDTVKEVSVSFVRYALRVGLRIELVTTLPIGYVDVRDVLSRSHDRVEQDPFQSHSE